MNGATMGVNELADALRRTLAVLEITVDELAGLLDTDPAIVASWTSGHSSPPADVFALFAKLLPGLSTMERVQSELLSVRSLVEALNQKILGLSKFDTSDVQVENAAGRNVFGHVSPTPLAPGRNRQRASDYEILRRQAWGRLVRVRDINTNAESIYRIAWGAESWGALRVWSRNGPAISKLMSVREGQVVDFGRDDNSRECEVVEVTLTTRHDPDRMRGNYQNFARLEHALDGIGHPREVADELDAWLTQARNTVRDALTSREFVTTTDEPQFLAPLTMASKAALSDRFFMDPLQAQEEVMSWPENGYAVVEGVAGSGKTSVALGRAAYLCMQREPDRVLDFTPDNGVGFVLSEQLVDYLEALLKGNLNLEKMPVKSYFRLRQELLGARQILSRGVRRVEADRETGEPAVGTSAWAEAAQEAMAPVILRVLLAELPANPRSGVSKSSPGVGEDHWQALVGPWNDFRRALPSGFGSRGTVSLQASLEGIDRLRGDFASKFENLSPWNSPKYKDDRRKVNQQIRDAIVRAYDYASRYFEILATDGFAEQVRVRLRQRPRYAPGLDEALTSARHRARARTLTNWDIDCLLLIAHRAALGYGGRDGAQPIDHLREVEYRTHVFVDEVQDFTEVQVRLMAAQADPRYRCVTAVGDFSQRLSPCGIESLEQSGLAGARSLFLAVNKRQSAPLHALSHGFRRTIQGEPRECEGEAPSKHDEQPFVLSRTDAELGDALRDALISTRESQPSFSMAVLCPSDGRARGLEASLHHALWEQNILSRISGRAEAAKLCDAFHVHFTTPLEAKGLEFDAVFIVDADLYDLDSATEQAALYVALSRARRKLGVAYQGVLSSKLTELFSTHLAGWGSSVDGTS